jgi:hypothetical protein
MGYFHSFMNGMYLFFLIFTPRFIKFYKVVSRTPLEYHCYHFLRGGLQCMLYPGRRIEGAGAAGDKLFRVGLYKSTTNNITQLSASIYGSLRHNNGNFCVSFCPKSFYLFYIRNGIYAVLLVGLYASTAIMMVFLENDRGSLRHFCKTRLSKF